MKKRHMDELLSNPNVIAGPTTGDGFARMHAVFLEPAYPQSEKEFQAQVMELARRRGYLAYHTVDSRKCAAGFPDTVICGKGLLVFAELKVGNNKPSAAQETWLEELRNAGAHAVVWHPEDWNAITETLK